MKKRVMTIVFLSVCACANVSRGAPRDDALSGTWRGVVRKGLLESVVLMEFSRAGSGYRGKFWGTTPVGAPVPLAGIELGHSVRFEVPRLGVFDGDIRGEVIEGTFEDLSGDLEPLDALGFADSKPYAQRIEEAQRKTGYREGLTYGVMAQHPRAAVGNIREPEQHQDGRRLTGAIRPQ